ncbi:hypothetical protein LCGC14_0719480 [marine sediment metagenome]|uniref:Uncharacterized protein n=1 Tax=marine sediment metagenome TaxID=412755 RepID=A0A0F9QH17_9ZZZZ
MRQTDALKTLQTISVIKVLLTLTELKTSLIDEKSSG